MEIEIRSVSFDMCKHLRNASAFVFLDEEPQTLKPWNPEPKALKTAKKKQSPKNLYPWN